MPSEHPPFPIHDLPRIESSVRATAALDEPRIVAVGHEADVLALGLRRRDEAAGTGQLAHLAFGQLAQRKQHMGQRVLGKVVQHVALVLGGVACPQKLPASRGRIPPAPGVVPRGHVVEPQLAAALLERLELQEPIAGNARVGRAALEIGVAEGAYHRRVESVAQIEGVVGNAEALAHRARIFHIARRPAGRFLVVPQHHRRAAHGIARFLQQQRAHGAIDAPRHRRHHAGRPGRHSRLPVIFESHGAHHNTARRNANHPSLWATSYPDDGPRQLSWLPLPVFPCFFASRKARANSSHARRSHRAKLKACGGTARRHAKPSRG